MLSHGNKTGITLIFVLALSFCSAVGMYRLKQTAEIRRWEKTLASYSVEVSQNNNIAVNGGERK